MGRLLWKLQLPAGDPPTSWADSSRKPCLPGASAEPALTYVKHHLFSTLQELRLLQQRGKASGSQCLHDAFSGKLPEGEGGPCGSTRPTNRTVCLQTRGSPWAHPLSFTAPSGGASWGIPGVEGTAKAPQGKRGVQAGAGLTPLSALPFLGEPFWARHLIQLRSPLIMDLMWLLAAPREMRCVKTRGPSLNPCPSIGNLENRLRATSSHPLCMRGYLPHPHPRPKTASQAAQCRSRQGPRVTGGRALGPPAHRTTVPTWDPPLLKREAFPSSLIPTGEPSEGITRDQGANPIKSYQRSPADPTGGQGGGPGGRGRDTPMLSLL